MGRQHDHDLLAQQLQHLESFRIERPAHEGGVQRTRAESDDRIDGVLAVEDQPQVGQARGHQWAQSRQDAHVRGRERAHRQLAGAAVGGALRQPPGMFDAAEDVLRLSQEDASRIRERHVMTAPLEQRHADVPFELSYLLAQGGLRCVQPGGRAREVQFLRHRHEVAQMPQFHRPRVVVPRRRGQSRPYSGLIS